MGLNAVPAAGRFTCFSCLRRRDPGRGERHEHAGDAARGSGEQHCLSARAGASMKGILLVVVSLRGLLGAVLLVRTSDELHAPALADAACGGDVHLGGHIRLPSSPRPAGRHASLRCCSFHRPYGGYWRGLGIMMLGVSGRRWPISTR